MHARDSLRPSLSNSSSANHRLWYTEPAAHWGEALPLGNGRLGAMVYSRVERETIQLNEETIYSGQRQEADNPDSLTYLQEIREHLFQRNYAEAERLCKKYLICRGEGAPEVGGSDLDYGSYETAGELEIEYGTVEQVVAYERELLLGQGIVKSTFKRDTFRFTEQLHAFHQETSIPADADVIVTRMRCDVPQSIRFIASLRREGDAHHVSIDQRDLLMTCQVNGGLHFCIRTRIVASGGTVSPGRHTLEVRGADEVVIYTAIRTSYWGEDPFEKTKADLDRACAIPYSRMMDDHLQEFSSTYARCDIDFSAGYGDHIPTKERIQTYSQTSSDVGLENLFFRYGRYLLISSSRHPGRTPANLQGIWCRDVRPRWNCDWHLNINLQMNYWPALSTNLAECHLPLFWLIEQLVKSGRETAKVHYGASGWVVHTITNPWFFTSPGQDPSWGSYPGATGWLCAHIMEHYRYEQDVSLLQKLYPIVHEAAQFYLEFLCEDPVTGYWVTAPSNSPENRFYDEQGNSLAICMAPTMDTQLLMELFDSMIELQHITGEDPAFIAKLQGAKQKLPPMRVLADGRLAEWMEDFAEPEPGHRHIAHLYGLHPAGIITPDGTPEFAKAAEETLKFRLAHGGGQTGWSRAWISCFYARLWRGDEAMEHAKFIIANQMLPNMFDIHPPFQIEGNFGVTSMMAELLVQSQGGIIRILPALPSAWAQGRANGLRARGGITIDLEWQDHTLNMVRFVANHEVTFSWSYEQNVQQLTLQASQSKVFHFS